MFILAITFCPYKVLRGKFKMAVERPAKQRPPLIERWRYWKTWPRRYRAFTGERRNLLRQIGGIDANIRTLKNIEVEKARVRSEIKAKQGELPSTYSLGPSGYYERYRLGQVIGGLTRSLAHLESFDPARRDAEIQRLSQESAKLQQNLSSLRAKHNLKLKP